MPINEPAAPTLASLKSNRDIYVYAETDEQTAVAANQLRDLGYQNVSELIGGLKAWKRAKHPIEGWWSMPVKQSEESN